MLILNNYNDYISDILLEKFKFDEISLVISDELLSIFNEMDHPIAKEILRINDNISVLNKITLLDIDKSDEDKLDNISFTTSTKTIENLIKDYGLDISDEYSIDSDENNVIFTYLNRYKNDIFEKNKNRSITSLGKIVNKLFPNKYNASGKSGEDIESFVNEFKSIVVIDKNFEIVKGDDIVYWYNGDNYNKNDSVLNNSCMAYEECETYLEFYSKNPNKVSLLILKDIKNNNLIRGRALIWNLSEPRDRIFMDRVYTSYDSDVNLFINYAKERGWLYREKQGYNSNKFIDPISNTILNIQLKVNGMKPNNEYPYLDTLCYYSIDGELSNKKDGLEIEELKLLNQIYGDYIEIGIYSDYYGKYINTDEDGDYKYCDWSDDYRTVGDCFYSKYYYIYIANDYAEKNGVYCDYPKGEKQWRETNNTITLPNGEISTKEYAMSSFYYDKEQHKWFFNDEHK